MRAVTRASRAPAASSNSKRYLSTFNGNGSSGNGSSQLPGGITQTQARQFSRSVPREVLESISKRVTQPYLVVGATERLFKICGEAADYRIPSEERKKDQVSKLDDGEEVGHSIATRQVWHNRTY